METYKNVLLCQQILLDDDVKNIALIKKKSVRTNFVIWEIHFTFGQNIHISNMCQFKIFARLIFKISFIGV